jgi:hypothetical protein
VHFGSLDFVIIMEGELVQAIVSVQSPPSLGLNTIIKALEELQLSALEARASERDQILDFNFRILER